MSELAEALRQLAWDSDPPDTALLERAADEIERLEVFQTFRAMDEAGITQWTYSFSACPRKGSTPAVFDLFGNLGRFERHFTVSEFNRFRHELDSFGIELTEIERVPYYEPESVPLSP